MEIWQALSSMSPGVAVGALCLYFYNQVTLKYLEERKEIIQAIAAERKEWIESSRNLADKLLQLQRESVEAATRTGAELHALRGKITEFMLQLQIGKKD